jgi:hypothetical protein
LHAGVQRGSSGVEDVRRVAGEEDPAESVDVGLTAVADGAADRGGVGEGQVRAEDPVQAGA